MTLRTLRNIALGCLLLGALALLQSGIVPTAEESAPELEVAFLDVGQGDSILITTPNRKRILIDGGPDATVLSRLGLFMRFQEHTFDLIVATHNHADHIGGINAVLPRYDVGKIWISGAIHTTNEYLKLLEVIQKKRIVTEVISAEKKEINDGVSLEVLHPIEASEGARPSDQHDATIVLRACYQIRCFLLTGDIDERHEQAIIENLGGDATTKLKADVLKIPHHGSKSGLALNLLELVSPQYAVVQVGRENRFGHPAPSILQKLESRHISVFRNDTQGSICARITRENLLVVSCGVR